MRYMPTLFSSINRRVLRVNLQDSLHYTFQNATPNREPNMHFLTDITQFSNMQLRDLIKKNQKTK